MSPSRINDAINLRLALLGLPCPKSGEDAEQASLVEPILARQREMNRRLDERLCPADQRIQNWLDSYLAKEEVKPAIPKRTVVLDQPGMARGMSLPANGNSFKSAYLESYRVRQGVLHNPKNDRRTTAGVFHIAEGGLPIPEDKKAVPASVFARLLDKAFNPPADMMLLPYTAEEENPAGCWVSLLLRPLVLPAVPGRCEEKRMETRFLAPGGLVCNLDFVEGIFGNAGDPNLPENDSALDAIGWTGHTGFVVLAPHLTQLTKKEVGLPHIDEATDRQRRDGMCWASEDELYNDGSAFKVVARDEAGVVVTVIADNYFGYCKKEIKTQISYSANLYGCAEEEHSGGALCFPAYNLGYDHLDTYTPADYTFEDVVARNPEHYEVYPEGYAKVLTVSDTLLIPGGAYYSLREQKISWDNNNGHQEIKLLAGKTYITPSGYRIYTKHREADTTQWHLVGDRPDATQCHKPATVSGGGKSEISKSLLDAFVYGSSFVADFESDVAEVQKLLDRDYSDRFKDPAQNGVDKREILSSERSLGSVIKLLTPREEYSDEYNDFLSQIPAHVKEFVFTLKRSMKPEWGNDWRSHFSVDVTNGRAGNSLRRDGDKIMVNMLRVGFEKDGSWRLFSLRPDFSPAAKVQSEDDITASTVCSPWDGRGELPRKYVQNCEQLLFQRPDDAVHRGYDKQAEADLSAEGTFISNFEPLSEHDAQEILDDVQAYSEYTRPMQKVIDRAANPQPGDAPYFVCSSMSRIVNGARSKNPRYLQVRPDVANPRATKLADLATHLFRKLDLDTPAPLPVDVVAAGRRNNPPEDGVPALCAYNPLHYMELPELFMEFISSMTGKSPSTTGAGSEGAMTKGPFNMLPTIIDLNAALLSFALTGYDGWLSSAGHIGPKVQVAHDISMLIPELFSRMRPAERDAKALVENGCLERMKDFEYQGRTIEASRLGYRINKRFITTYFGRIFLHPDVVFTEEILKPEIQDEQIFVDSIDVIVKTHQRVARMFFDDGTISLACPPLKQLLTIMAYGKTEEGWTLDSPEFRQMFDRENILASDWYAARLNAKQVEDIRRSSNAIVSLRSFIRSQVNAEATERMGLKDRLADAEAQLTLVSSPEYRQSLVGTVGRQPLMG